VIVPFIPYENAERILQAPPGWEPIAAAPKVPAATGRVNAESAKAQAVKSKAGNGRDLRSSQERPN